MEIMRFHWYWPFARPEEMALAHATARSDESIVVDVVDRAGSPAEGTTGAVTIIRSLPEVDREALRIHWLASRSATFLRRNQIRSHRWHSGDFDLAHIHYANRFTDTWSRFPLPTVLSVHDVLPHVPRLGVAGERKLLSRLYSRPDALVVHHHLLADQLIEEFSIESSRIHVVPHQVFPVDAPSFLPPDGPPVILFFGALRANKGLQIFIEAIRHLEEQEFRFLIAGRGDRSQESLAREIASEDDRVKIEIGYIDQKRKNEIFRSASVIVMPYTSFHSTSGVLHDAYGHGRPVIVTNVGALGITVNEDNSGVVVPQGDPISLATAIELILEPTNWTRYAEGSRRIADERSPVVVGRLLRSVYDRVLEERAKF